jgi:hypothetical protein
LVTLALAFAVATWPARASDMSEIVAATYDDFSMSPPTAQRLLVCHGFNCQFRAEVALSDQDRATLKSILTAAKASAAAERTAIGKAGAWFDRRIARDAGTQNHVARAGFSRQFDDGQFDCVDSSRNMTSLLLVLDELKLLRFHSVDVPVSRGLLVDGRGLHITAVLRDRGTGVKWAVDSWTQGYGQAPDILPVSVWMTQN